MGGWRNIGEDQEKSSRVMVEAHPKVKEDAVGVKMKIGGGGLGEEKEEDWKRKIMTWPDWPEEVEIAANKEISEEIQAGTSDEIRRISDRCEDEAAVSVKESEEIQMERETRRKREEVVAREIEEIMGGESLEEIREEEEEKLEWGTRETDKRTIDRGG